MSSGQVCICFTARSPKRLLPTSPFRIADPVDHFKVYHPIAVHRHYTVPVAISSVHRSL